MSICIKKIELFGNGKINSAIEFTEGLNIIKGPSNCGKTLIFKCIDFCLGSENNPLIDYPEYSKVEITLLYNNNVISISRENNSKTVYIHSNEDEIVSGEYNIDAKDYENSLTSVLLQMIGIRGRHDIVKNANYKKQELTWRSFYHLFFLDENRIISDNSPLIKDVFTTTSTLSILIFLLFNKDFSNTTESDSKQIKETRINAVKNYLNSKIQEITKRTQELETELKDINNIDEYENNLNTDLNNLEQFQTLLNDKINENSRISKLINEKNKELIEKNSVIERFETLKTQYTADLSRLNFIIDGQINYEPTAATNCPFCNNIIHKKEKPDYFETAINNYKTIKLQLSDLSKTTDNTAETISILKAELSELKEKKNVLEKEINNDLKPRIEDLKKDLLLYKQNLNKYNELQYLRNMCNSLNNDISKQKIQKEKVIKYNPKDYLEDSFFNEYMLTLQEILKKCKYKNFNTVNFDEKKLDMIINGRQKSSNGKGYKAFYNSVMLIALSKLIFEKGIFKPNILILDSPILPLRLVEIEEDSVEESIKCGLFEYLQEFPKQIQTIVIENEIPNIDYKNANIIEFTKDKTIGRYGFIIDYYD